MGDNCDFFNNDIQMEKVSKVEDCIEACRTTLGCTHFRLINGECWKKYGSVTKLDAFWRGNRGVCGILEDSENSGIFELKNFQKYF